MADIILKDKDGTDVTYENVNSVSFRTTTEGETATFIAQKQVDWNQTDTTAVDYIKNKPQDLATKDFVESHVQEKIDAIGIQEGVATEEYVQEYVQEQISNIEIPDTQVQADWNQTDTDAVDYIKNKPQGLATESYVESYVQEKIDAIEIPDIADQVQANWEENDEASKAYVQNRPFYVDHYIVPQTTLQFEKSSYNNNYKSSSLASVITENGIEGKRYVVEWDGVEYVTMCRMATFNTPDNILGSTVGAYSLIGNSTLWNSDLATSTEQDTGEPFVLRLIPEQGSVWNAAFHIDLDCIVTSDEGTSHTIRICCVDNVVKIGAKYLPDGLATDDSVREQIANIEIPDVPEQEQADWNVTDASSKAFIQNKPEIPSIEGLATEDFVREQIAAIEIPEGGGSSGGGASNEKVFLEETEIENLFNLDGLIGAQIPFTDYLNIGETYYVNWNGVEYEVTNAQDATALMQNLIDPRITKAVAMGNGETFGLSGNNEPFTIITTDEVIMFADLSPEATIGGKNIVRIYQKTPLTVNWENVTDKPFGDDFIEVSEGEEIDLLVEQDISGFAEQNGLYVVQISPAIAPVIEGEIYSIYWDGVLYSDLSCFKVNIGNVDYYAVGNIGLMGGADTGEPFVLACVYFGDGTNIFIASDMSDTHKIRVFQKEPSTFTIKESYISILDYQPGVTNEFLTSTTAISELSSEYGIYGIVAFTIPENVEAWHDGRWIDGNIFVDFDSVTYECAQQRLAALDNGIAIGNCVTFGGTGNDEPFLVTMMSALGPDGNPIGVWMIACLTDNAPTQHTARVYQKTEDCCKIKEDYIPDSVKLPIVTADDNNKFLRIVNGVPTWVTLTDVSTEGA